MYRKLLFLALLSGCGSPDENKQANPQPLFSVDFLTVKKSPFQEVYLTSGNILANEAVMLQSEVSAKITGTHFTEGAQVKKGQLLFSLHDKELKAQLKTATARHQLALSEAKRRKELLQVNGVSAEEYEIAASQALQYEGEKELLQAQLERYQIYAPLNGKAGLRMYSTGALVSPGNVLTQVVEDYPVKIEFELPARFYAEIKTNDTVSLELKGASKPRKAVVFAKDPQINENTRSFKVRALNADKNQKDLIPGKFIQVGVSIQRSDSAIMIPTDALIPIMGSQRVFVYRNGTAQAKEVVPGYRSGEKIEILQGLNAGDTLITSGLLTLRPEAAVQLRKSTQIKN